MGAAWRSRMHRRSRRANTTALDPPRWADLDDAWQAIDWSQHIRKAVVRNRHVRYTDLGSGPTVLLIHGQGGSWEWWLRVLPTMAAKTRIIALDLAGFGESEPILGGDVFDEHVATAIDLLDQLGVTKATIVGHSMGGLVSLQIACLHPDRVSGLALVNGGGVAISPRRLALIVAGLRAFNAVIRKRRVADAVARNSALRTALHAAAVADRRSVSTALALEIVPHMGAPGFVASLEAAAAAVYRVSADNVASPSLVIWGTRDRILPLWAGRRLATEIPDASFVTLEGVGHCPMIETPEVLSRLITDFAHDPLNGRPTTEATDGPVPDASKSLRHRRWRSRRFRRGKGTDAAAEVGRLHLNSGGLRSP
jgi:pimeloyl-ACP methyl ester carboxylesterase